MTLPTLYFLKIEYCGNGDWGIFESHRGQELGCFETEPQLIGWAETQEKAISIAEKWEPLEGIVDSIEVDINESGSHFLKELEQAQKDNKNLSDELAYYYEKCANLEEELEEIKSMSMFEFGNKYCSNESLEADGHAFAKSLLGR